MISIRSKIILYISFVFILTTVVFTVVFSLFFLTTVEKILQAKGENVVSGLVRSPTVIAGVIAGERKILEDFMDTIFTDEDIVFVYAEGKSGNEVLLKSKNAFIRNEIGRITNKATPYSNVGFIKTIKYESIEKGEGFIILSSPVFSEGDIMMGNGGPRYVGRIYVGLSLSNIRALFKRFINRVVVIASCIFLITFVVMYIFVSRNLVNPLKTVVKSAENVSQGDLTSKPIVKTLDELGELSIAFSKMSDSLRDDTNTIKTISSLTRKVAEEFERVSDVIMQVSVEQKAIMGKVTNSIKTVYETSRSITENMERLKGMVQEETTSLSQISATVQRIFAQMEDLSTVVVSLSKDMDEFSSNMKNISTNFFVTSNNLPSLVTNVELLEQYSQNVSDTIKSAVAKYTEVNKTFESISPEMSNLSDFMSLISSSLENIISRISDLLKRIREIHTILSRIEELADDTNLLALNASVIASHAGERGREFSKISDEIKKLSEDITGRVRNISTYVGEIFGRADDMKSVMDRDVMENVAKAKDLVEKIENYISSIKLLVQDVAKSISSTNIDESLRVVEDCKKSIEQLGNNLRNASASISEQDTYSTRIFDFSSKIKDISFIVKQSLQEHNETLKHIYGKFGETNELAGKVTEAVREQEASVEIVSNSVGNMKRLSDDASDMVEIIVSLSQDLTQFSERMEGITRKFKT